MITKHGMGLWSTTPPSARRGRRLSESERSPQRLRPDPSYEGPRPWVTPVTYNSNTSTACVVAGA